MAEDTMLNLLFQQIAAGDMQVAPLPGTTSLAIKLRNLLRLDIQDSAYVAATNTTSFTATAAQVAGANTWNILNLTGTLGAGATLTLPTVAAIGANNATYGLFGYDPASGVADTFILDIYNSSGGAYSWTVAIGSGWTLNGTLTIAQNTYRRFQCIWTSATAITGQSLGQFAVTAL